MDRDQNWAELEKILREEVQVGGDLVDLPCPVCGLPRCSRSDYIRCSRCAINWMDGDELTKNPTMERYQKMVRAAPKKAAQKAEAKPEPVPPLPVSSPLAVPLSSPDRPRCVACGTPLRIVKGRLECCLLKCSRLGLGLEEPGVEKKQPQSVPAGGRDDSGKVSPVRA